MKAIFLTRHANPDRAFEFREIEKPSPAADELLIKTTCSGLNFADVMIRRNLYEGAPKLPSVIGFDLTGNVVETGSAVHTFKPGDKVIALCRFGAYAEYVCTPALAAVKIPEGIDPLDAVALSTQYLTAYYAASELVKLHPGDKVLIQSGAGGLGQALIQFALYKKCILFSTAGSDEKIHLLQQMGVHYPINYIKEDFQSVVMKHTNSQGVDVIFDGIGGASVRKGFKCLDTGGRIVCHGASVFISRNLLSKILCFLQFGFYHPVMLMMPSKSILAINMLPLSEKKPAYIQQMLTEVVRLAEEGIFTPKTPHRFAVSEIEQAHLLLESRKSMGKICICW